MESGRSRLTYLDTHAALWLCSGDITLSPAVSHLIDTENLVISPMVLLEMQLLQEIGRVNIGPDQWVAMLRREFGVAVCEQPFQRVVEISLGLKWTRDPFDRLIVAQAIAGSGALITKDRNILNNFDAAIW